MSVKYRLKKHTLLLFIGAISSIITQAYTVGQAHNLAISKPESKALAFQKLESAKSEDIIFKAYVNRDTLIIKKIHSLSLAKSMVSTTIYEFVKSLKNDQSPVIIYSIDNYQIQIYSDAALVYYTDTAKMDFQENKAENHQLLVDIYQRRKGCWRQICSHVPSKGI